jgi:hypothetical protein
VLIKTGIKTGLTYCNFKIIGWSSLIYVGIRKLRIWSIIIISEQWVDSRYMDRWPKSDILMLIVTKGLVIHVTR